MNQVSFTAPFAHGDRSIMIDGVKIAVPEIMENLATGKRVLGVRPEHIRFDAKSPLKAKIYGTEYLGTTQIVALEMFGAIIRARAASDLAFHVGETVGVTFETGRLSLFNAETGLAVKTSVVKEATYV
jgi:multiple sugar transport system ATP-binding protein